MRDSSVESCGRACAKSRPRLNYGRVGPNGFVFASDQFSMTRTELIDRLNEDLAREYQAIIAYVIYSQVLKGAQYMSIAKELEKHAGEELAHALTIAKHIDYLGGMPTSTPKPVVQSDDAETMLRADLDNENAGRFSPTANVSRNANRWGSTPSPKTSARFCGRSRSTRSISPPRSAKTRPIFRRSAADSGFLRRLHPFPQGFRHRANAEERDVRGKQQGGAAPVPRRNVRIIRAAAAARVAAPVASARHPRARGVVSVVSGERFSGHTAEECNGSATLAGC